MPTRGETQKTQKEILQYVFDVLDTPNDARTYLIEKEGINTTLELIRFTKANFNSIHIMSNGTLSRIDTRFLQLFSKWYCEAYLENYPTEELTEILTERVFDRYVSVTYTRRLNHISSDTPYDTHVPLMGTQESSRLYDSTKECTTMEIEKNNSPTSRTNDIRDNPTESVLPGIYGSNSVLRKDVQFDITTFPTFNGELSTLTWADFRNQFEAVATSMQLGVLMVPEGKYELPDRGGVTSGS